MLRSRTRTALVAAVTLVTGTVTGLAAPTSAAIPTAAKATTITLVTHDSFSVSDSVLSSFTRRTGITVKVLKAGDAGEALSQVVLTKGSPLGDVFYGVDNTFLSRALESDVFERYESPELAEVPSDYQLDARHRVTPIDRADVCVNGDAEAMSRAKLAMPRSLDDLTKPAYRGKLVVENPATSSPGLAFLFATIAKYGNGWKSYWEKLRANDVEVVNGWTEAYYDSFSGGGAGGDRPLVVSYASSPAAAVYFAEDPKPTKSPVLSMTADCFEQVEFAGILRGTGQRTAARALVDFMLSERFQEDLPLNMFVYPVRDGAELPAEFAKHAAVPEESLRLAASRVTKHRADWIAEWTEIVLR